MRCFLRLREIGMSSSKNGKLQEMSRLVEEQTSASGEPRGIMSTCGERFVGSSASNAADDEAGIDRPQASSYVLVLAQFSP